MEKGKLLFALLLSVGVLLVSCRKTLSEVPLLDVEKVISAHTILHTEPPSLIPTQTAVDAPLLGNGSTGIAISGTPERQTLYISRNDFWRLRSAYGEGYPLVLGKIHIELPKLVGASYLVEQRLYEAITTSTFEKEGITVTYDTYVSATEDILVVELRMKGAGTLDGRVHLDLPGELELINAPPIELAHPGEMELKQLDGGISYLSRAFTDSVEIPTKAAISLRVEGSADGTFVLEQGKPVRFVCAFSSNFKSEDCVATVIRKAAEASPVKLQEIDRRHREWWRTYWSRSLVSIPDKVVEKQYYVSLYTLASCSRDPEFPPSIFGTWITQEQPWWCGDYHLNYNHMAPYYGLYSANRMEQADPYYHPLLAFMERGRYYSESLYNISDGILMPVGIGPKGIETTRWTPLMDRHYAGWRLRGNVEGEGLFWKQKSNGAYCVANLSMQFYHTYDSAYTARVYPFVKGVATFWEGYVKYENGRYNIYNDAIHESHDDHKNPLLSLGLVRLVMQTAVDISDFLSIDSDRRYRWMHIRDNLASYPTFERGGKEVFRYTEEGTDWVEGNTLGIQHIYPGGQIGLDSNPVLLQISRNTVELMQRWYDFNGSNSFFPAAARVGYMPDSLLSHLHKYSLRANENGFQSDNPHGIENLSTVPNTINGMLCSGHQNVVRLFPVWPRALDATFQDIRVEGAFLVSARLSDGEVTSLTIFSERGRLLTLQNPWMGRRISVVEYTKGRHTDAGEYEGKRIEMPTRPGTKLVIQPL